ncbi:hypothetical protein [Vibrio cholerae]|uniref:hypothetical protein n=1 Tax=Vibrio cholerae TaxID=666 RepID=UPI0012AC9C9D|nr:hypothetical protein [Vibrio cholerae]MCX9560618.1 hypothetical protein [Vibrio cholerae]MCX9565135.1 hypothetical protein [Vibrio cholerae]
MVTQTFSGSLSLAVSNIFSGSISEVGIHQVQCLSEVEEGVFASMPHSAEIIAFETFFLRNAGIDALISLTPKAHFTTDKPLA